ncbi:MAG: hypothetical protein HKM02_02405 [Pseudomonadales bacterium]|nr:hypothetical protein [Pseudomonadales bacterium]
MQDKRAVDAAWLEIVETAPGEVELRREGDVQSAPPLLRLQFSSDAQVMLGEHLSEVTRVMIAAGLQAVGDITRRGSSENLEGLHTLH